MYFIKKEDKRTLAEWMEDNNFSEQGQKALDKLATSIATNKNEILAIPFFSMDVLPSILFNSLRSTT